VFKSISGSRYDPAGPDPSRNLLKAPVAAIFKLKLFLHVYITYFPSDCGGWQLPNDIKICDLNYAIKNPPMCFVKIFETFDFIVSMKMLL